MASLKYYNQTHEDFLSAVFHGIQLHFGDLLTSLAVFGSYARGENRLNSDLDLLIVLKKISARMPKRQEDFVLRVENPLEELRQKCEQGGVSVEISPLIIDETEAGRFLPIYLDMVEHHHRVVDRGDFLKNRLREVRQKMSAWGSRRHELGGHWYWEIRPGLKFNEVIDYDQ